MEAFECQGYWWPPDHPNKCPGLLRCDESGELRLYLFGSFDEGGDWFTAKEWSVIFGEIVDLAGIQRTAPNGRFVTLLGSFVDNQHHSSTGPSTQSLFSHRAFVGDQLLPAGGQFKSATVCFSGLAGWADDITGLRRGTEPRFSMAWHRPEEPRVNFPRGTLLLGTGVRANHSARRWVLEEDLGFHLTYHSPVTDPELSKDVWAFQNLLTFATDRPNALTRLEVQQAPDESRPLTVVGPSVFADETVAEGVHAHNVMFGHAEVANRFEDVIRRWFALSEQHSAAFAIYFGLKYNPPRYSDLRFQLMAQALSLYAAGRNVEGAGSQTKNALPYNFADRLDADVRDALVRTHPLVVLMNTLRALTTQYARVFDPLISAGDERSRVPFLELASHTFQYITGRESGAPDGSKGMTYNWLTELLGFIWKITLLDDLGFSPDEQSKLLARNRLYQHIRDRVAPELFGKPGIHLAT